jgi:hemolysin activation/secretion protein
MTVTRNTLVVAAAGLFSAVALSNPYPNSGSLYRDIRDDSLRRVPEQREEPRISTTPAEVPVNGESFYVSHFVVYGNNELLDEELTELLAPYSHRELTARGIHEAAEALRMAYRARGLFVAEVYIPPQAVVDGIVTLHVYEGVLEKSGVELANRGKHVRDSVIEAILEENLATGETIRRDEFERAILLVDDLPGVTSHSILYPATEPGEARFLLQAEDTPAVTGNVDFDNFGSYYTGEERLGATVYLNSPTRRGDQVTVRAVTSGSDSNYLFLDYSVPVTGSGLRVGANADYLDYELGKEYRSLEYGGDAASARLFVSYPFLRSRHSNLNGRVEYAYLTLKDKDDSGELLAKRRLNTVTAGVDGDHDADAWANGITYFSAGVTAGSVDVRGGEAFKDFDRENLGIDGGFARLNAEVSRLQHITGNWSTYAGLAGQWASGNLDSSQKFYIGGPFSVPGYPTGEASGDHGANLHLDLRRDFLNTPWGGDFQASLFYTTGWARLFADTWEGWKGDNPIIKNDITLSTWGLSLSQTWASGLIVRASVGWQLGNNEGRDPVTGDDSDGSDRDYRAWIQTIYYF